MKSSSGFRRRTNLARVSLPFQAARPKQGAEDLRAVSAAVRLEFVVCVAEFVAAGANRGADRGEFAPRRYRCAAAFFGESVPACSAAASTRGGLAVLVYDARGTARDRKSTRLNSSHGYISYAVFCLKKKKNKQ